MHAADVDSDTGTLPCLEEWLPYYCWYLQGIDERKDVATQVAKQQRKASLLKQVNAVSTLHAEYSRGLQSKLLRLLQACVHLVVATDYTPYL